ncbi:ATP-binding cassette domain-containing protein [Rhizobium beringeri]
MGYLPQDVELFLGDRRAEYLPLREGDVARGGGCRSEGGACSRSYLFVCRTVTETEIGEGGAALSAGQRQRIALARALYGEPFLVVLDEPNSNLDEEGERALSAAIMSVRARGGIVVVIAHRSGVLAVCDFVLMMQDGRMIAFGPKEEVLARVSRPEAARTPIAERVAQLKVVVDGMNAAE